MPQVPRLEPQVREQGLPNVQFRGDLPVEAFGGGQGLSQSVSAFKGSVGDIGEILQREKDRADDAKVQGAYASLLDQKNKFKNKALELRGEDALSAHDVFLPEYDKYVDEVKKGLKNRAQTDLFERMSQRERVDFQDSLVTHGMNQSRAIEDDNFKAMVLNLQNDSANNLGNPAKVRENFNLISAAADSYAQKNGYTAEMRKNLVGKMKDATHERIVSDLLAKDNNNGAINYFNAIKASDSITAEGRGRIAKLIEDPIVLEKAKNVWANVSSFRLGDGVTPDVQKMEAFVGTLPESDERKQKITAFIKARAQEDVANHNRMAEANEASFKNVVSKMKLAGASLDQVWLKANEFAVGPADQIKKEDFIRELYAPPQKTTFEKWDDEAIKNEVYSRFSSPEKRRQAMMILNSPEIPRAQREKFRENLTKGVYGTGWIYDWFQANEMEVRASALNAVRGTPSEVQKIIDNSQEQGTAEHSIGQWLISNGFPVTPRNIAVTKAQYPDGTGMPQKKK